GGLFEGSVQSLVRNRSQCPHQRDSKSHSNNSNSYGNSSATESATESATTVTESATTAATPATTAAGLPSAPPDGGATVGKHAKGPSPPHEAWTSNTSNEGGLICLLYPPSLMPVCCVSLATFVFSLLILPSGASLQVLSKIEVTVPVRSVASEGKLNTSAQRVPCS
ncbi:hypothetical protein FHG87_022459, partial [Trinorchestia longiramus]